MFCTECINNCQEFNVSIAGENWSGDWRPGENSGIIFWVVGAKASWHWRFNCTNRILDITVKSRSLMWSFDRVRWPLYMLRQSTFLIVGLWSWTRWNNIYMTTKFCIAVDLYIRTHWTPNIMRYISKKIDPREKIWKISNPYFLTIFCLYKTDGGLIEYWVVVSRWSWILGWKVQVFLGWHLELFDTE